MGFSAIGKGNHRHMVLLDTSLHVDAVTVDNRLPCHKYLKEQQSENSHPYNPPASLSPALDNMKDVTELMAGLCTTTLGKEHREFTVLRFLCKWRLRCLYSESRKTQGLIFSCLYTTQIIFQKTLIFVFAPLQLYSKKKKYFQVEK